MHLSTLKKRKLDLFIYLLTQIAVGFLLGCCSVIRSEAVVLSLCRVITSGAWLGLVWWRAVVRLGGFWVLGSRGDTVLYVGVAGPRPDQTWFLYVLSSPWPGQFCFNLFWKI